MNPYLPSHMLVIQCCQFSVPWESVRRLLSVYNAIMRLRRNGSGVLLPMPRPKNKTPAILTDHLVPFKFKISQVIRHLPILLQAADDWTPSAMLKELRFMISLNTRLISLLHLIDAAAGSNSCCGIMFFHCAMGFALLLAPPHLLCLRGWAYASSPDHLT